MKARTLLSGAVLDGLAAAGGGVVPKDALVALLIRQGYDLSSLQNILGVMHSLGVIRLTISGKGRFSVELLPTAQTVPKSSTAGETAESSRGVAPSQSQGETQND